MVEEHDDAALVRECLAGNTKAFEALVDKYQKVIFNVAYRMINNYDDAEDITQSVFIKVYEKLNIFNPKFKFFSWLYRMAVNESLNYLNQKKRTEILNADSIVSKEKTPEEIYTELELSEKIQDALMELDPDHRILIVLRHFQDCSYKEMSYILDIPEKTVKSRLFTARQLLKTVLIGKRVS